MLLAGARDTDAATAVMLPAAPVLIAPVAAVTRRVEWEAAPYIAVSVVTLGVATSGLAAGGIVLVGSS